MLGFVYNISFQFTFHYVSINSTQLVILSAFTFNLHSTMYLLIPLWDNVSFPFVDNLHSTMYLLIQHCAVKMNTLQQHLHSTMYLLIPVRSCTGFNCT